MKKFIALICILMLIPIYSFAAVESVTFARKITSKPEIAFEFAEETEEWPELLERIAAIEGMEDYTLLDAFKITLDEPQNFVIWNLLTEIKMEHQPVVLLLKDDEVIKLKVYLTNTGSIVVNFADYELGTYYILFYIKL